MKAFNSLPEIGMHDFRRWRIVCEDADFEEKDSNFPFGPVLEWKYSPKIDLQRFFL